MDCYCEIDYSKIPDWIQAFGALVAAVGLVVTLYLQRRTLEEQQNITKLETQKFVNSYLPLLEIRNLNFKRDGQKYDVRFEIVIKENYLQSLTITHDFPYSFNVEIPYYIKDVILPKDYILHYFQIEYTLPPVFEEMVEYSGNTISFNFDDAFGNSYTQHLVYKGSDSLFLHPAFKREKSSQS